MTARFSCRYRQLVSPSTGVARCLHPRVAAREGLVDREVCADCRLRINGHEGVGLISHEVQANGADHCTSDFGIAPLQTVAAPRRLAAVSCYFNPTGGRALRTNYRRFVNDLQSFDVPLFVAEVAYNGQPFIDSSAFLKLHAGPNNILWQKERLLNLLVERLPEEFDAVAWIDADVLFLDRDWPIRAVEALVNFPAVQLWDRWHFTGPRGEINQTGVSVGHLGDRFRAGQGHPGGAWAAWREVFPLDWSHILGGGDTAAVEAWLGVKGSFLQQQMMPGWRAHYERWADEAGHKVRGRITTLEGDALHLYHGMRTNRRYGDRSRWLLQHNYDPLKDIGIDAQGLLAWTNEARPELRQVVRDYFFQVRQEDEGLL